MTRAIGGPTVPSVKYFVRKIRRRVKSQERWIFEELKSLGVDDLWIVQAIVRNIIGKHIPARDKLEIRRSFPPLNRAAQFERISFRKLKEIIGSSDETFSTWWKHDANPVLERLLLMGKLRSEWPEAIKPTYFELDEIVPHDGKSVISLYFESPAIRQRYIARIKPKIDELRDKDVAPYLPNRSRPPAEFSYDEGASRRKQGKAKVALEEAKLFCQNEAKSRGVRTIVICREYLETHLIKGKPNYTAKKLSHLISSEFHQGRTKKYQAQDITKRNIDNN
jgi:hypothetical protein